MRVCAVQMKPEKNKAENLDKVLRLIAENASGCDLIIFPEMTMGGKTDECSLYDMAENIADGDFSSALSRAAKKHCVCVCACLWEKTDSEKVYNTAAVYGKDGKIITAYRKLHLFDALSVKESDDMLPGDRLPEVFYIEGVKCSLGICYDLRFPEVFRQGVFAGAELFIVPAAWYSGEHKVQHLKNLCAVRALENTSYLVCADLCGERFTGFSGVYDPYGMAVASAEAEERVIAADIRMERIADIREKVPCVANFRKDIFKVSGG